MNRRISMALMCGYACLAGWGCGSDGQIADRGGAEVYPEGSSTTNGPMAGGVTGEGATGTTSAAPGVGGTTDASGPVTVALDAGIPGGDTAPNDGGLGQEDADGTQDAGEVGDAGPIDHVAEGGATATCVRREPPAELEETLDATWSEMTGQIEGRGAGARPARASVLEFRNLIFDQVIINGGTLNYCVRYETDVVMSAVQRDALERALERSVNHWFDLLEPEECFPFPHIPVKVVGWAAMDRGLFDWADSEHPGRMYIGDDSFESAPQCAQSCGRFFHQEAGYDYPGCEGGMDNHYDMSLWLTEGFNGGAGGDWGQRVGRAYFMGALDQPSLHIHVHEVGHGLGFPDYYNWSSWFPGLPVPHTIMVSGAAQEVTEWDGWMMRRAWAELKGARGW